jgi:hypothetical protein
MSTTRPLLIMLGASFVMLAVALALSAAGGQESLAADGIIYVDADAVGANNGTSWEDAFTTLQPALGVAVIGDQIWVAAGTYTPTYLFSPGDPRSATFQLKNGVALYGGFDPTVGDVGWEDRDWVANPTIVSGDIGTAWETGDNSYHVFYHPSELALDGTAVLDGFSITGGNANTDGHYAGGGMYNGNSSPTVANCTFSHNSAYLNSGDFLGGAGGGMYNSSSSPVVTDCIFSGNSAFLHGGGMANFYASSPAVTNCTFWGNDAQLMAGGAIVNYDSSPMVTNCTFSDNSAAWGWGGGAMYNRSYSSPSSPIVTNCILWGDRG